MTRLCWCGKDASHRTIGGIVDYLCSVHADQAARAVKVEQIFQDCDESRCNQCGGWAEIGAYGCCSDCLDELDRNARVS